MNSEVDFAAGGIVLINNKILLVKNKLSEEYKDDYSSGFWGYPKGHLEEKESPIHISNISHITKDGDATRIGYIFEDGKKIRISNKTKEPI